MKADFREFPVKENHFNSNKLNCFSQKLIVASGGTLPAKSCFANPFAKRLRAEKKTTMRGLRADYARRRNK